MASNRKSDGLTATFLLGSGETAVANGKPYLYGDLLLVITALKRKGQPVYNGTASAEGDEATGAFTGVWELEKTSAQAWAKGIKLYWDAATSKVTSTASTNVEVGWAWAAAANPSGTGFVKLKG